MNDLLKTTIIASLKAGKEILRIYDTKFDIEYKDDNSPLTLADKNANDMIVSYIEKSGIPILSEEGRSIPFDERKSWNKLWIVDPLDGTKEFVNRNDEFTVNIALVEDGVPILGVVYAPVLDILYFGEKALGSFKLEGAYSKINSIDEMMLQVEELPLQVSKTYFGIVASRSHLNPQTTEYINKIRNGHDDVKIISKGSSLKICMIAEGVADVYPRFGPTSEWDTAAGHAVVLYSGGRIVQANSENEEVIYNKENILNPWFIAKSKNNQ